jgi:hypothetical protein
MQEDVGSGPSRRKSEEKAIEKLMIKTLFSRKNGYYYGFGVRDLDHKGIIVWVAQVPNEGFKFCSRWIRYARVEGEREDVCESFMITEWA